MNNKIRKDVLARLAKLGYAEEVEGFVVALADYKYLSDAGNKDTDRLLLRRGADVCGLLADLQHFSSNEGLAPVFDGALTLPKRPVLRACLGFAEDARRAGEGYACAI
jgi:hypothetical protein